MTRAEIINLVLVRIDAVSSIAQTEAVTASQVAKELNEAAFQVLAEVKREFVYPAAEYSTPSAFARILDGKPISLIVPIANSFIRFLRARAHTWRRGVDTLISVESNVYRQQTNPYQRATVDMPVATLIPFFFLAQDEVSYQQAIELFPAPASLLNYEVNTTLVGNGSAAGMVAYKGENPTNPKVPIVSEFLAISRKDLPADDTGLVPWPEKLIDAITWLAAVRCLTALREIAPAQAAAANYKAALDGRRIGMKAEDDVPVLRGAATQ